MICNGKFSLDIIPLSHCAFTSECVDDGEARVEHTLSFTPAAASEDHFRTPHLILQPSHFMAQTEVKSCTTLPRDQIYHRYFPVHLASATLTCHFQYSVASSTTAAEETSDQA